MKKFVKLMIVKNKNNTLYFLANKNMELSLYGIEIEKNLIYTLDNSYYSEKIVENHKGLINKKIVKIDMYIKYILSKKIEQSLRLYKLININDYSFYDLKFIYNIRREITFNFINVNETKKDFYFEDVDYSEINDNIVILKNYNKKIRFNLETKDIELFYDNKKTNYLDFFYDKDRLNYIIASEQYNRGIAPKILNEVVSLQKFLIGKKSVKIITKDFKEYVCKSSYNNNIFNLIAYDYSKEKFKISKWFLKEKEDIDIKDVLCFKYGSKDYYINSTDFEEKVS